MATQSETFVFQAEINQLMSLIIHAFYSNKEIFLRELVANASDAMDKYRHYALTNGAADTASLRLRIRADKTQGTLTIEDNGVGMSRQDLIDNLGTIARSGTKQFIQTLTDTKDMSLIGQFGVGFYSAYLVADKVTVYSRGIDGGDAVFEWVSDANGSFTIRDCSGDAVSPFLLEGTHGTQLVLQLKEDQVAEFTAEDKLRTILLKHSGFIGYPIELEVERPVAADAEGNGAEATADEEGAVEDVDAADAAEEKPDAVMVKEWDVVNKQKPVWMRKAGDVTEEEYNGFYKAISNDWDDPLATKHFNVEGQLEFRGLLYIPKHPPYDMFGREKRDHLKLYVRRVFISDNSEDFIPEWLSFVRGVVDSDDLPLNVSREMLQQNRITKVIRKNIVKKCIEMMTEVMDDREHSDRFDSLYENFGKNIKLGIYDEDEATRNKLIPLLRFYSSKSGDARVSLTDYVTRMKDDQKAIYYIAGESVHSVSNAPFIECLKKKGYEVLYLVDTMDEYLTQRIPEFEGKRLVNVTKEGDLELDATDGDGDEDAENSAEAFKPLCDKFAEILGDKVEKVIPSVRLTQTPAVLVSSSYGWTANMERIMKAQALQNNVMSKMMSTKKVMEINTRHRMIRALRDKLDEKVTHDMMHLIYEASMVSSGFGLEDPGFFVGRVYRMIELGLNLFEEAGDAEVDAAASNDSESTMEQVD